MHVWDKEKLLMGDHLWASLVNLSLFLALAIFEMLNVQKIDIQHY